MTTGVPQILMVYVLQTYASYKRPNTIVWLQCQRVRLVGTIELNLFRNIFKMKYADY